MDGEVQQQTNMSASIGTLAKALAAAQSQIEGAKKDNENPFFHAKYSDLASVWDACRTQLSSNGLAVIQTVDGSPEVVWVTTTLAHSSGEWIRGTLRMKPVKADPQGIGSAITYARRYALAAIVGVAPEDDDGNAASGKHDNKQPPPSQEFCVPVPPPVKPKVDKPKVDAKKITGQQRKLLFAKLKACNVEPDKFKVYLKDGWQLEHTIDILKSDIDEIIEWTEAQVKATENKEG